MSACRPRIEYDGDPRPIFFCSYAPGPGVPFPGPPVLRAAVPKPHFGEADCTALLEPANAPPAVAGGLYVPGPGLLFRIESLAVRARIEYDGWSFPTDVLAV